jgi:SAM-dependent methyltransferase
VGTSSDSVDHEGRVIDFGRTAVDYERFRPGFPDSFFDRLTEEGWIKAGKRVLDLGTGTGTLALGFASRGLHATGLDIAPELLDVARQKASDEELDVRFVEGEAEATGQEDNSFDIVSSGQCWWWFDSDAAIRESTRVLVPGGRLVIASFSYLPIAGNVAGRTEDLILRHNPGWPKAGWGGVHPEHVEALDRGGYRHVESFSYTIDMPFTHEAWRGRVRTCNGVGSALNATEVERFDAELAELLAREFPDNIAVPHRVFVTSGVRPPHEGRPSRGVTLDT